MALDLAMLDGLAPPSRVSNDPRPPIGLEEVFDRVVADGWAPRNPAFGAELEQLDAAPVSGNSACLSPLVLPGDLLLFDRYREPQSGELVVFQLGTRGAAAQGGTARPGDHWCKLHILYRGIQMLCANKRDTVSATLMACESPNDKPQLWPVRNIRRNSKLLFTPEISSTNINPGAATITAISHASPTGVSLTGASGVTTLNPNMSLPSSPAVDCTAIVTLTITARQTTGAAGDIALLVQFADDGVTKSNSTSAYVVGSVDQQFTLEWQFSHLGSNATKGKVWAAANPGSTADTLVYGPCTLQVEYLLR